MTAPRGTSEQAPECDAMHPMSDPTGCAACEAVVHHHQVLSKRKWTDEYPDDLWVSVEVDDSDGIAHVVFSAQAAWMNAEQVEEILAYVAACQALADQYNTAHRAASPPLDRENPGGRGA